MLNLITLSSIVRRAMVRNLCSKPWCQIWSNAFSTSRKTVPVARGSSTLLSEGVKSPNWISGRAWLASTNAFNRRGITALATLPTADKRLIGLYFLSVDAERGLREQRNNCRLQALWEGAESHHRADEAA
jgi:hypothetical protein